MTSAIDYTKPVYGNPTTQSVRDNFSHAYDEITDLQNKTTGAPFLPISGGIMNGTITMQDDPTNPLEVATKRYIDNLAFGQSGGTPEAPTTGLFYARGQIQSGMTWSHDPLFSSIHIGPDKDTDLFNISSDATYNFIKLSSGNDYLRFNRTTNTFEMVTNNAVSQSWSSTGATTTNLIASNNATIVGTAPALHFNSTATADEYIYLETNGLKRWALGADTAATGFGIFRYDAAGVVIDKPFAIARTDATITMGGTYKHYFDARGNIGVGKAPPANAGPIDTRAISSAYTGGWILGWGFSGQNIGIDSYYEITNQSTGAGQWHGLRASTRGWNIATDATNVIFQSASAATVNAGDNLTMESRFVFEPFGRFTMHANTANDAIILIDTARASGYARIFTANTARSWSFGVDGVDNTFGIYDNTANAKRFAIDTAGAANFTGMLASNGTIQSSGGRLISYGGNNCSVTCYRPGAAAGMFLGGGDTNLYFASMDGTGAFQTIYANFNSGGDFITQHKIFCGNGGSLHDPLNVSVAQGYNARTAYTVANVRSWSCGVLTNGHFAIGDESGGRSPFDIDTDYSIWIRGIGFRYSGTFVSYGSNNAIAFGWATFPGYASSVTVIVDNGGAAYPIANASDARMKTDVDDSNFDCLATVESFPLRQFKWLNLGDDPWKLKEIVEARKLEPDRAPNRIGMIAQEIAELFPEGVVKGDDFDDHLGRVWSFDQNTMLALYAGAIKQLNARIQQLEAR